MQNRSFVIGLQKHDQEPFSISGVPYVTHINLSRQDWTISDCERLTDINIPSFTIIKLQRLLQLNHIAGDYKELTIDDCPALIELKFDPLKHKRMPPMLVHDRLDIKNCPNLLTLDTMQGTTKVTNCPNVLEFSGQDWETCQKLLPQLTKLRALDLTHLRTYDASDKIIEFLLQQPHLQQLEVLYLPNKMTFRDRTWQLLSKFSKLRMLAIDELTDDTEATPESLCTPDFIHSFTQQLPHN